MIHRPPGLRRKLNLAVLPILVAGMALFIALDYRHEWRSVDAAHALHGPDAALAANTATTPEAVAGQSLRTHLILSGVTIVVLAVGINLALSRLVLKPLRNVEIAIEQLERGRWRVSIDETGTEELERLGKSFRALGLSVGALMLQTLNAERLAMLALISKRLSAQLEPELLRLGTVVGRLAETDPSAISEARHNVAVAAAGIQRALHDLDRLLDAGVHARRTTA